MGNMSQGAPSSKLAIISFRLGVIGLLCLGFLTGIPAIILGFSALIQIWRSHGKLRGARSAAAAIVMGAIGFWFYALFLYPWLTRDITIHEDVTRAHIEMRTVAVALEAYYLDYKVYPAQFETLTTPIAYMSYIPKDPFAKGKRNFYSLFEISRRKMFIVGSLGPDHKRDCSEEELLQHTADEFSLKAFLKAKGYDPSNGTLSNGDIIFFNERSY